ncbi:unnamed protein product [Owenia fusiformis]|uniref:Uncharacterized protein n=1 Tax=Owenia fusiformis TaxID=6347 RepID=A0A8J1UK36_OWEFU|nr:unnamed protein product [Owenia fusiformis]
MASGIAEHNEARRREKVYLRKAHLERAFIKGENLILGERHDDPSSAQKATISCPPKAKPQSNPCSCEGAPDVKVVGMPPFGTSEKCSCSPSEPINIAEYIIVPPYAQHEVQENLPKRKSHDEWICDQMYSAKMNNRYSSTDYASQW